MHEQSVTMRDLAQVPQLVDRIQRAEIRRLRQVEREWLHARRITAACQRERRIERGRLQLVAVASEPDEFRAGEQFGRAALIHVDVRRLVAVDRAVRIGQPGQRDGIRARAGRQRERQQPVVLERMAKPGGHRAREVVVAVRGRRAVVCSQQRFEQLGRDATDVVAAEIVNFDAHWTREWTCDRAHPT